MDGTNHSASGLPGSIGCNPPAKLRLAGLALTVLLGSILITWVNRSTAQQVNRLQRRFGDLKADSFYLGVHLRARVLRLNDTLLRYRLRGDVADYEGFHNDARELKRWIEGNTNPASPVLERAFFKRVQGAYDDYLSESMNVVEASRSRWQSTQAKKFPESYQQVQHLSQRLLNVCDTFIRDQRVEFESFLRESQGTLESFQRLLELSLALLLTLTVALVLLVYRGMIAPLWLQLTESQAVIARQEKLASLGVLAAGVAHEIRNPLTAIKFRLFSLKNSLPGTGADNEDAVVISNEINRLERIVKDFLQFARPSEPQLIGIPARRILQEVCDLLKPQLEKAAIELKLEPAEPAWVRVDSQQIKQVLINLIQNSADSIGRNGAIILRARPELPRERKRGISRLVLEVADNGKGIPPEVQKRLFDPFFTTKEGGSGLGLPIAARIVEKHGGELRYQTQIDRGTTFGIVLPISREHETQNPVDRR